MQNREKIPSSVSRRNMPTDQLWTSDSEHVDAPKTTPSSSSKSAHQNNFVQKWDEIKSFLQFYIDKKFIFLQELMVKQHEDSNHKRDKQHTELISTLKHNKHTDDKDGALSNIWAEKESFNDHDVEYSQKEDVPSKEKAVEMDCFPKVEEKGKVDDELGGFTTGGAPSLDNVKEMDILTKSREKEKKGCQRH